MNSNPKLEEVIKVLKKEGYSDEEIQKFIEELTKMATAKLYTEITANLTEEDKAEIEKLTFKEEVDLEIKKRFYERSGKSLDDLMQEFLTTFAQGFLDKYQEEKAKATLS